MAERIDITDEIAVGSQPSPQDLDRLAREGYRSVFNLRASGEEDQPMQPADEAVEVENRGMEYHHLAVVADQVDEDLVDEFREEIDGAPVPVFVHCKGAKRAAAFSLMKVASDRGMSGQQALDEAEDLGLDVGSLRDFVRGYVDSRGASWATGEEVGPRV